MLNEVLRYLRRLTDAQGVRELTDGELLQRFRGRREEVAFAALVERHGPLVWAVCRRVLHDAHLAEDAFQATFLVLARKAGSIRKQGSLGSWLHGVAYRVAVKARTRAHATRAQERRFVEMPRPDPPDEMTWHELRAVLDEELNRLPEKYRAPVVLCYLEGQTHDQAARQLGCPRTSLSSRLGRARALLHERLVRRGLALSAGLLATLLAEQAASAQVPAAVMLSAIRAATAGSVSPGAAALAQGVLQTMSATKIVVATALAAVLVVGAVTAVGPQDQAPAAPPPQTARERTPAPAAEDESPLFRDMTPQSGVDFTYRNGEEADQFTMLESVGGGVALIDYDGDGLLDIFLPGGGEFAGADKTQIKGRPCKLYKNLGKWKFKDVTKEVGLDKIDFYTHGCAVADYDRDGWPDLFVTGYGQVALFHNEPDGKGGRRFVDVTRKAGLTDDQWSTSAAWADFDGDGLPDLYVCHYVDWSFKKNLRATYDGKTRDIAPPKNFNAQPHRLFRNNGDGTFTDVSKAAGLSAEGKGLGVIVVDVDGDGKPDVYVANDTEDNFLYHNRSTPGNIRFDEVGLAAGVARDDNGVANGSKGVAVGDYDNSGRLSLLVTNYQHEKHALYRNEKPSERLVFSFASQKSGLTRIGQNYVGWGTGFFDLDHDGWLDLFIANGHNLRFPIWKAGVAQRPVLLRNEERKAVGGAPAPPAPPAPRDPTRAPETRIFADITGQGGPYFEKDHRARGVAFGDLDNDGRIDMVISHVNEPVVLLRNEAKTGANHWLGIELEGKRPGDGAGTTETDDGRVVPAKAVDKRHCDVTGAKLVLEVEGLPPQTRYATGGGSFASASDPRHVFGLGTAKRVGKLTVRWPSGKEQSWEGLAVDQYWRLVEGEKEPRKAGARGRDH
jgi:RNA polymerase sigma factor (sigma-70 family)